MRIALLLSTASLSLAALINRQITAAPSSSIPLPSGAVVTTITTSVFPNGVSQGSTAITSSIPLVCIDGCYNFSGPYGFCFIFDTYPDGRPTNRTICPTLCTQEYYYGLSACLNCIVANGNEVYSPPASARSTSSSSSSARPPVAQALQNPFGSIDANQGNMWLRNLTEYCSVEGRSTDLTGATTVTASPTTTGPYSASWTSGETISRTAWTGLTQYSPPVATLVLTVPASRQSGPNQAGGSSNSAGAAAASSSTAAGVVRVGVSGWIWGGAILAWAVL